MKKQVKTSAKKHTSKPAKKAAANKRNEEDFPGYPQYPADEDIMNRAKRIDVDVDTALEGTPITTATTVPQSNKLGTSEADSDLTKDDFQALASDEIESTGDDEVLTNRTWPVDFAGEDLDIPGSEDDDAQEMLGNEDEENNSYSIGSDRHEDLETDKS
jgi:hypothetical protein